MKKYVLIPLVAVLLSGAAFADYRVDTNYRHAAQQCICDHDTRESLRNCLNLIEYGYALSELYSG
jgi:hypothetical protein